MAEKPWLDKMYLYDRYTKKKMTINEIADECTKMGSPVTPMTIWNNLKKFDLLKNPKVLGPRKTGGDKTKKGYYK